ncbi:hypothetical protein ACLB2K_041254 [Fragaria x ananassa]
MNHPTTGETVGWKALTSLTKRSGVRIPIKALVASRRWPLLGKCAWCVVFAFMPRGDAGISPAVLGYPAWGFTSLFPTGKHALLNVVTDDNWS